jgi:nucleotide-binding universal stress UspA family protein
MDGRSLSTRAAKKPIHHGPPYEPMYSRILLLTEGFDCSLVAGRHAVYLAERLGAELLALYVVNVDRAFEAGVRYGDAAAEIERGSKKATDVIRAMADEQGVRCEVRVAEGYPDRIMAEAGPEFDADLLVICAPKTDDAEWRVRDEALRHVQCPVLVVRE